MSAFGFGVFVRTSSSVFGGLERNLSFLAENSSVFACRRYGGTVIPTARKKPVKGVVL